MAYGATLTQDEDPRQSRKERGAFFTPPVIADFLCTASIRSKDDKVLEPACGEASFLFSAARRFIELGASIDEAGSNLCGCELHKATADAALRRLQAQKIRPTMLIGDFFSVDSRSLPIKFDAVVGNPPFIRYQAFAEPARTRARERAFAMGVRLDALASSWAPFLVHATSFLKVGGRVGMVLPAELLSTNYAAPVRKYLLDSFSSIELILFEKPVFPEVTEEVVLLVADGFQRGRSGSIRLVQLADIDKLGRVENSTVEVHDYMKWTGGTAASDATELLSEAASHLLVPLSAYGSIHLGAVSGANKFFAITTAQAQEWGIPREELLSLCPPGSRHLRNLRLTQRDYEQLLLQGKQALLLYPNDEPSGAVRRYLNWGEDNGINLAYKCRTRKPWWRIPGVRVCDLFFTYMNGIGPNLCANDAGLVFLNSVHGLFVHPELREVARELLPLACLSSVTLLSAELTGRSYGGGILKLEPREASNLLVASPKLLLTNREDFLGVRDEVEVLLGRGNRDGATMLVDDLILPMMGFAESERTQMHRLLVELRDRRANRGRQTHGKRDTANAI